MKLTRPFFLSIIGIMLLGTAAYYPQYDSSEKEAVLMQTVVSGLQSLHFDPKPIDDELSTQFYETYLDYLDGSRRFLTEKDITALSKYNLQLDDELKAGTTDFLDQSIERIEAALEKTQGYYRELLAAPFTFDSTEEIELDPEKRGWAKNDKALKDYWHKYLKYETMTRLADKLKEQENQGEEAEFKSQEALEQESREEVLDLFDKWFERMGKLKREDRMSTYLNAFTSVFDPHSSYYKPIDKENFNIRFSGRLEGIGARLQSEGDYTKVSSIVVGGPAWKGKELEENDLIMKVRQEDEDQPVDITGMVLNDVVQLIRGPKGTKVTLTVKKVDGVVQNVVITRDLVVFEERFAKSLILDGKSEDERIGYIYLPSFYADFEDKNGRFCSKDVEKEIEKLKAEKVDGIILDLRNNGGGSLRDVVKMSGYFIEKGPIVQVKSRDRKPDVLNDVNPNVKYDGPLVVMVNSNSASASEILAAAMQDYERAVIVGSQSTFGKGTVQSFIDLDRAISGVGEGIKPLGEIKVTRQKFYRINGGSTQLKGVTPDIILPDRYFYLDLGEKEQDNAMPWTEIGNLDYDQRVYRVGNMAELKARSASRVKNSKLFQSIVENARQVKIQRETSRFPVQLEAHQKETAARKLAADQFGELFEATVNPGVINLEVDLPSIHADESKEARNDDFIKSVSKDVYIQETLNIMHDMISLR